MAEIIKNKFLVVKTEDINKHLSKSERKALVDALLTIRNGRILDGKKPENEYWIVNQDEPYADKILQTILENE